MRRVPGTVFSTVGLIGGYAVARGTRRRALGGAVMAACGVPAFESWRRRSGVAAAAAVTGGYVGAAAVSHPLAKKLGAWPSVFAVTALVAATGSVFGDGCRRSAET
ncbi:hypothetical protein FHX37_2263 [Haloactinospora alba]|uniref:Uncharacterized protein n=1 Tax=Haloactinospora alba TaxID=405555 RepID=A0A543NKJ3_9ACTN|nr:hypothetical protein [Haloactinospora alba]TQN32312.1 hypothetical protein FHX37_2263 [Haloactinospora alba]